MASIRKRKWRDGKTAYVVDWIDKGRRHNRQFRLYRDADAFRRDTQRQMDANTFRPDGSKLFMRQVCEDYLQYCEGRHRRGERMTRNSLEHFRRIVGNHILSDVYGIGAVTLAQLTTKRVYEFVADMRSAGKSVVLVRHAKTVLHGVMKYAMGQDWTAANPVDGVRVIGRRDEEPRTIVPPSKETVAALLAAADSDLRLKIWFAAATGARAGEQWGLRWRCVDLNRGFIRIEVQLDRWGKEQPPKSKAGVREIPLSRELVAALKVCRLKSPHSLPDDPVFLARRGGRVQHSYFIAGQFRPLLKATGLHVDDWHALRHYAISCWIEGGLAAKTVQTFAGHSKIAITYDRYGHLFPHENHHKVMDRIAAELAANMRHTAEKE